MTDSVSNEQVQLKIIQYLYGGMDAVELEEFERELQADPELRSLLDQEQSLNSALPLGMQPSIADERIQGNRWLLHQRLQKEVRPRFSLVSWFHNFFSQPLNLVVQGAAMAATFVLGVMVAGNPGVAPSVDATVAATTATPLALVQDGDYEIYELQVNNYDVATGDIDLTFSLASETRLRGNVADQQINRLMAVALQNDIDSASRLDTINALQPVISGNSVYEALIHVLLNDQNPGVRYQAVVSLTNLASEDKVRDALRQALAEDVNQGVRVEAFNALLNYRDEQTLNVFRERMVDDSNEYIRTQARQIVEGNTNTIEDDGIVL